MIIDVATEYYNRDSVKSDSSTMYIFTDNTDRDSGSGIIDNDSWYIHKYGCCKHYPKVTSAVIRGLDNAYPITTQHYYNKFRKGISGRWNDSDFDEFKSVIDDDFDEIIKNASRFNRIVFPCGGFFETKISNISKTRTPMLYHYLYGKLRNFISSYFPEQK